MPEKAIVFDIDGTLVDSVDLHTRAWQEAFLEIGSKIRFAEPALSDR
jgi:beta-phosphoglucomutase-like phosphatase (HAD superfamily)